MNMYELSKFTVYKFTVYKFTVNYVFYSKLLLLKGLQYIL